MVVLYVNTQQFKSVSFYTSYRKKIIFMHSQITCSRKYILKIFSVTEALIFPRNIYIFQTYIQKNRLPTCNPEQKTFGYYYSILTKVKTTKNLQVLIYYSDNRVYRENRHLYTYAYTENFNFLSEIPEEKVLHKIQSQDKKNNPVAYKLQEAPCDKV